MVQSALADAADPEKAAGMQAYMKTDMPFYGVQKPERARILRRLRKDRPDLHERVLAGECSPHAAMVACQQLLTVSGLQRLPSSNPNATGFFRAGYALKLC